MKFRNVAAVAGVDVPRPSNMTTLVLLPIFPASVIDAGYRP
jgi:hypothetical protein